MPPWEPDRNEVVFEKWEWLVMADQAMLIYRLYELKRSEYIIGMYTLAAPAATFRDHLAMNTKGFLGCECI